MKERLRKVHIGTVFGILVACYIGFYLIKTVQHNYELQKQIDGLQGEVGTLKDQQDTLKYQIQYYQTDAYKEKEARAKLGLQAPGEGVVIIPHKGDDDITQVPKTQAKPKKSHWQLWMDFLSGKTE